MRRLMLLILLPIVVLQATVCQAETTTVFLVRHAEKATGPDADKRNPVLSETGEKRAKVLARTLRSAGISACFASEYKRTQLTATPTATAAKIKVTERGAGQESKLATEIKTDFVGKSVLFVGHSNTVPNLMKHLGASKAPKLKESHYDNLFILHISDNGSVNVTRVHYGEPDPEK